MITKEEFIKDFMKKCNKEKKYGLKYVPKGMKNWGCKMAAEHAWKKFKDQNPDNNKKNNTKSRIITSSRLYDNLTLKW